VITVALPLELGLGFGSGLGSGSALELRLGLGTRVRFRVANCCIQTAGEGDKMRINHVIKTDQWPQIRRAAHLYTSLFHHKHGSTNNKQYIIKRINTTDTHTHTHTHTQINVGR